MRVANQPIRIILLKARQWGGSTLTQIYMAWIQTIHRENWHSLIITDVESQARNIRSMYTRFIKNYPKLLGDLTFSPFENSTKNKIIKERGCVLSIGSMQKPDALRSTDNAMAHFSEAGFFKSTENKKPEDLIRSIRETIPDEPYTLEVLESTANGFGSFFHQEYLDAEEKRSGYKAVFIPWFQIQRDWLSIKEIELVSFIENNLQGTSKDVEYNQFLWSIGATLEGIKWYNHHKKSKNYKDIEMNQENPSTSIEAFQSTGRKIYSSTDIERMRKLCTPPLYIGQLFGKATTGKEALEEIRFEKSSTGEFWAWALPDKTKKVSRRYCVTMDIGGKTTKADWSVIRVFDRYQQITNGPPEAIATWKGHIHTDLLGWIGAQIAKYYHNALLIPEANYLVRENKNTEGSNLLTILNEIAEFYDNIYVRENIDDVKGTLPTKYGFWMTKPMKGLLSDMYMQALRITGYKENDERVLNEAEVYEVKDSGELGAADRFYDDMLIATQIGYWACISHMELPYEHKEGDKYKPRKILNEATF